ncbi:hypothetical protein SmJEL517_g01884 [Synchytrium microbalum]|uniref:Crinkler effector protein N-terminal domain-containing protein n=1 Tax=Synchytrium microbalum TaxID=1806994 RepID=A0A507CCE9_9FUNG|nr:uncharacterized protein SmJEL517_g01884 [Synchytrium microbalum]TPX35706.1 hypothetical protein SmJEL517_g01884 [Synchytrium microbalum]
MSDTTVLWLQLFKRNSDRANDQYAAVEELGDSADVEVDVVVTNISKLRKYLINHERFKKSLDGIEDHQLYVYIDAECETPLKPSTSITQIETSDDNPLRVVRPAPPVSRMSFTMEDPPLQAMQLLHTILWNKEKSMRNRLYTTVVCNVPTLATMQQVGEFDTVTPLSPLRFTVIQLKDLMDTYRLQGLLPSFPLFVDSSTSKVDKLLVNEAYTRLHDFLKSISAEGTVKEAMTSRAIIGNPGIGKSLFLLYELIERLLVGAPTALQNHRSFYYYFSESGVAKRLSTEYCPSRSASPTWALVDSNQEVDSPCGGFLDNKLVLVLQATSPKVKRYKEWTKQARALYYYMNTWTWEEIAYYGSEVLHLDVNRLWEAWNDWNPCPRYCFNIAKSDMLMELYQNDVFKTLQDTKENLFHLLLNGSSANPEQSSRLVLISGKIPSAEQESANLGRVGCKVDIIGKQVIRMIGVEMEKRPDVDRKYFYNLLGSTAGEAAVRGTMLEARMHHLMSTKGPPLTATCLTDRPELLVAPREKVVSFMKTDLSAMLKDNESGYFWPIASNQASFDGFIWDRKTSIIILLQATVSVVHPIKQTGLDELRKAFRDAGLRRPDYPWPLVFCTSINELGIQTTQQVLGVWNTRLTQYTLKIPI